MFVLVQDGSNYKYVKVEEADKTIPKGKQDDPLIEAKKLNYNVLNHQKQIYYLEILK